MVLADFPDIQRDVLLKGHCTLGVGGPADYFYALKDWAQLEPLVTAAQEEQVKIFILGGGSNVVFHDDGYRGLVLKLMANDIQVEGDQIVADAGAKWAPLLKVASEHGLTGLEPFTGLPGTLGGAVAGNAGCFGTETKDIFASAAIFSPDAGAIYYVDEEYFDFKYRWSRIKDTHDVVLRVRLQLKKRSETDDPHAEDPTDETPNSLQQRFAKQPPGRTSGSFFKNPSPDQAAGYLIDQCGLKGLQIGDAQISPKHANFFMNTGQATAADLLALRDRAKAAVKEKFGITLHEEAVIVAP